jgi:hypothetical protein
MAADRRNRSTFRPDPQRGDHMNPYGRARGAKAIYWVVGALIVAAMSFVLF